MSRSRPTEPLAGAPEAAQVVPGHLAKSEAARLGLYRSSEVCALAGITYRQLDYWRRSGLIDGTPSTVGSGFAILWTADQLEEIRRLAHACPMCQGSGIRPRGRPRLHRRWARPVRTTGATPPRWVRSP